MRSKSTVAITALAGFVTAASAQTDVVASDLEVRLTWSDGNPSVGDTVTATLTASWTGSSTSYLSSVNIDLIASSGGARASDTAPVAWNLPILGFDGIGQASGADIIGLDAAQFSLFAPPAIANPFVITTFTILMTGTPNLSYTARNSTLGAVAAFTISDTALPTANPAQFGAESFVSDSVFVPSPAGGMLLGCAGMFSAGRRRRSS